MTRRSFIDSVLGKWSSHPAHIASRARWWAKIAAAPLSVGIGLYFVACRLGSVSLASLATNWDTWLPAAMSLAVLGFSFGLTSLLALRLSTAVEARSKGSSKRTLSIWTVASASALLAVLAFVLSRGAFLGSALDPVLVTKFRWVGHLLGTVPLVGFVLYAEFRGCQVDEWGEGTTSITRGAMLRRTLLVFGALVAGIMPMIWIDQISQSLREAVDMLADPLSRMIDPRLISLGRWLPFLRPSSLQQAVDMVAAGATLLPLLSMATFVGMSVRGLVKTRPSKKEPVEPRDVATAQGYMSKPCGERWGIDGKSSRPNVERWREREGPGLPEPEAVAALEEGASSVAGPPWLESLQAKCPQFRFGLAEPARIGTTSRPCLREDLDHLFVLTAIEGRTARPTEDQIGALKEFDERHDEALRATDREGLCVYPSSDLIVSGPQGSGRTTLLLACALRAVVLRGQSVLLLVSSPARAVLHVQRLREAAERSGVGWHVSVGMLDRNEVLSWSNSDPDTEVRAEIGRVDSPERMSSSAGVSLPFKDILVGTPHDYERCLYGPDGDSEVKRRMLLRLQVVLVDDVTELDPREQRHLPFVLDKHRLVLGAEFMPVQFVAVTPPLSKTAAESLGERLFGQRERARAVELRPWEGPVPWVVDASYDTPAVAVEELARVCVELGLDVVIHQPASSKDDRSSLQARLGGGRANLAIVADFDELRPDQPIRAGAAIYQATAGQSHVLALRSHVAGDDVLVVRVAVDAPGTFALDERRTTIPVLPGYASPAFFVAHARSALHHLAPRVPVSRDLWSRCGLGVAGSLHGAVHRPNDFRAMPGAVLALDPPESDTKGYAAARDQEWAWVAVDVENPESEFANRRPDAQPVEMYRPVDRGQSLRLSTPGSQVSFGKEYEGSQAIADWSTNRGDASDRMDLAFADTLLHPPVGERSLWPTVIRHRDGKIHMEGEPYRHRGSGEFFLPMWEVSVDIPDDAEATAAGAAAESMALYQVQASRMGSLPRSEFGLVGVYDEVGSRSVRGSIKLAYDSMHYALVLQPQVHGEEPMLHALKGRWDSQLLSSEPARCCWPALGVVLTAALRSRMPSLFEFCRLIAFHGGSTSPGLGASPTFAMPGTAVIWLVEPMAARGTVKAALRILMSDADLLQDVLREARSLAHAGDLTPDTQWRRALVRARFCSGQQSSESLAADLQAACDLLAACEASLGKVLELRNLASRT